MEPGNEHSFTTPALGNGMVGTQMFGLTCGCFLSAMYTRHYMQLSIRGRSVVSFCFVAHRLAGLRAERDCMRQACLVQLHNYEQLSEAPISPPMLTSTPLLPRLGGSYFKRHTHIHTPGQENQNK